MRKLLTATVSTATLALAAGGALAQSEGEAVDLSDWTYADVYESARLSGETLLEMDVVGQNGEEFGEVENVWLDGERIAAVSFETGGFLDVGDSHVIAPWDEMSMRDGRMVAPVSEETIEDYDMWREGSTLSAQLDEVERADDGDVYASESVFRLTDVIDDYAMAEDEAVGYVDDVLFSEDGEVQAVVFIGPSGTFAAPFYGRDMGYAPRRAVYPLNYTATEVESLEPFDRTRLELAGGA